MMDYCSSTAFDAGPTSSQQWLNITCLLGDEVGINSIIMQANMASSDLKNTPKYELKGLIIILQ